MANLNSKLSIVHVSQGETRGCWEGPDPNSGRWCLGLGERSVRIWEFWWEVLDVVLTCVRNHSVKSKRTGEMTSEC